MADDPLDGVQVVIDGLAARKCLRCGKTRAESKFVCWPQANMEPGTIWCEYEGDEAIKKYLR